MDIIDKWCFLLVSSCPYILVSDLEAIKFRVGRKGPGCAVDHVILLVTNRSALCPGLDLSGVGACL